MSPFVNAPLPRHEALAPLSRDHYVGLVQARRLIKAAQVDDAAQAEPTKQTELAKQAAVVTRRKALSEFVDAWDLEIAAHLDDEERLLADRLNPEDRQRLLAEHQTLWNLADQARQLRRQVAPDPAVLQRIGRTLEQHIRWEERELFGRIQQQLTAEELSQLQGQTQQIERQRARRA